MSTSKTAVYQMCRDGWRDYFELHVSPTQKTMLNHAEKIYAEAKHELPDNWSDTLGLVLPMTRVTGGLNDGLFAYCFLNMEHLGVGIVSHECLHVSMAHERFVLQFKMEYGDGIQSLKDEERLAHFLTQTVSGVYNVLYDNKHIKAGTR